MNRRTLIKSFSLFAGASFFSVSTSVITSRRANAQQYRRVNLSNSSCARSINAVFQSYKLKVESFDIRYRDGSGNRYQYASSVSSNKSIEKFDEQLDIPLTYISSDADSSFSNSSRNTIAQQSLDGQVFNGINNAMAKDRTTLISANLVAQGPNKETCSIIFPCNKRTSYCPRYPG